MGSALIRTARHAVGRRSRGPAGARVHGLELTRYVGPGRPLVHSHGMIVRIRADDGERSLCGIGEAVAAPAQSQAAWRRLTELAAGLVDSAMPDQADTADPLRGIDGWQPVRPVDSGSVRAAKLALEMALLDLLMKAGALAPAAAPSPASPQVTRRLPGARPGSPTDSLSRTLREDVGRAWAVRLRLTGDTALDLAWLRHVAEIERAVGRDRPIWLIGGDRQPGAAQDLVRQAVDLIAQGETPPLVLLEEPLARKQQSSLSKYRERSALPAMQRRSRLSELQQVADEALGRTRLGPTDRPRLAIVAGDSLSSANQVRRIGKEWPVGGLHLSLARWGTLTGIRDATAIAKHSDPATLVLLGGGRGSRLTASALQWLVAATPEIDRCVPEVPAVPWPTLALPEPGRRGRRTGLFPGVNLAELATVADEIAAVPEPPSPAAVSVPNRFPDHPLPGEALARRSMLLETEALRVGLRTRRLSRDVFLAEDPATGVTIGFTDSESSATGMAASVAAARKGVARDLLALAGLPVPEGAVVPMADRERAYEVAGTLGFPLVVKPAGGSKGVAVTVNITSHEELDRALDEVASSKYADTGVLVERFVRGNDYRVLATRDETLSVVRREPASVVGDGQRSVEELVLAANVARRQNPHLAKRPITLDARVDDQLRRQDLARRSVPETGRRVRLRAEANFSLGGESAEVLDDTHASVCELAVAAVTAVPGLPHAGLDILMDDHRLPVDRQRVTILEVNSRPVQSIHHFPMFGPPRNVSQRLVRDTAEAAGVKLGEPADEVTVRVVVSGRVQAVGYRRWMLRAAKQLGVSGWVGNAAEPDRVEAVVHGRARWVGMLLRLAFDGPPGASVVEVAAEPVDVVPAGGFTIYPDGS
jgi:D-alanine-D-alanine ligase-like ATP-grasp enzyme/acylphosphatase/L-alanine-DL-glutamate epimerase-like enolase superfamily enzyme